MYKDVFAWTYKIVKGIPSELAYHVRFRMNPNYVADVK
jgi:hypothetical protein